MSLVVSHNAGFFSCCAGRLYYIIRFCNENRRLPEIVDCSKQFEMYKPDPLIDVTYDFFQQYDSVYSRIDMATYKTIPITLHNFQHSNYKTIDYGSIVPFCRKYFTPSEGIQEIYWKLIDKYNIDLDKCIGLYYRATDKGKETRIDSFERFYEKAMELYKDGFQLLIQTDSTPFLEYMQDKCQGKNIVVIKENKTSNTNLGIHNENTAQQNHQEVQIFLATVILLSQCKYVVCTSGNVSVWIMYYRGGAKNTFQNLNCVWY
jgi:hypothetical protein